MKRLKTPAIAASATPIPKVTAEIRSGLTPTERASSGLDMIALVARPRPVWYRYRNSRIRAARPIPALTSQAPGTPWPAIVKGRDPNTVEVIEASLLPKPITATASMTWETPKNITRDIISGSRLRCTRLPSR